jgi:hypothetical protein
VILLLSLLGGIVRAAGSTDRSSGSSSDSNLPRLDPTDGLIVGQCISAGDFAMGDPKPTECSNPSAVLELVSRGGANAPCPDGKSRDDTDYTTMFWDNATMCFAANFIEGDCYAVNTVNPSESPFTHEDCADSQALIKVVQRVDGTTDTAQCAPGTKPISYPHPARLYCIEAAH